MTDLPWVLLITAVVAGVSFGIAAYSLGYAHGTMDTLKRWRATEGDK